MALVAHVHGCALGVARRFPRRNEGVEAARRTPAREKPARALRIAEPAPEPVNDDQLELARPACDQPGALVDVVSGGQEVGQHPGPGGRGRDEPEATRVVQPRRDREYLSRDQLDDPLCRLAVLGWILHQSVYEFLLELSVPGILPREALDSLYHKLRRLAGEIEHEFGRHLEAIVHLTVCPRTRLFSALCWGV